MTRWADVARDVFCHTPASVTSDVKVLGQRRTVALFSLQIPMHYLSLFAKTDIISQISGWFLIFGGTDLWLPSR
jgi:hypothetical protein